MKSYDDMITTHLMVSHETMEDLITLVDFCNEVVRCPWPRANIARIVAVAHDMAHVLTGGDGTLVTWDMAKGWAEVAANTPGLFTPAAPDVFRRMDGLIERLGG